MPESSLVELHDVKGNVVYVNPSYVTFIQKNPSAGSTVVGLVGDDLGAMWPKPRSRWPRFSESSARHPQWKEKGSDETGNKDHGGERHTVLGGKLH